MKLTKKQLSASYAVTVALPRDNDGVANHRNSRFDGSSVASPKGKVESITHVGFCTTSGDKAMESIAGPGNQPGVAITPLQLYVEEGPQSVKSGIPATEMARRDGNGGDGDGGYLMMGCSTSMSASRQ